MSITVARIPRPLVLTAALAVAAVGASCAAPPKKAPPERVEGGRKTSPSRRASDERPRPWVDDKRPFDSDRTGVEGYRVDRDRTERGERGGKRRRRGKRREKRSPR